MVVGADEKLIEHRYGLTFRKLLFFTGVIQPVSEAQVSERGIRGAVNCTNVFHDPSTRRKFTGEEIFFFARGKVDSRVTGTAASCGYCWLGRHSFRWSR